MATMQHVIDVDEAGFASAVLQQSRQVPVVVDFWAAWCGPCRVLGPILERLATEMRGAFVLAKIDVDRNRQLAAQFGVQGIPAVKAFRDGKLVDQFEGALPEKEIRAWLKKLVPSEVDLLLTAAADQEQTDPQSAAVVYRRVLQAEPGNSAALLGLGRVLLLQGDPEAQAVLAQIKAGSKEHATAQALLELAEFLAAADAAEDSANPTALQFRHAAQAARRAAWQEALQILLQIVQRDRAWNDDAARKAMLGVFNLLSENDPLVPHYRKQLANALF